jgi:hypothetical protein
MSCNSDSHIHIGVVVVTITYIYTGYSGDSRVQGRTSQYKDIFSRGLSDHILEMQLDCDSRIGWMKFPTIFLGRRVI